MPMLKCVRSGHIDKLICIVSDVFLHARETLGFMGPQAVCVEVWGDRLQASLVILWLRVVFWTLSDVVFMGVLRAI